MTDYRKMMSRPFIGAWDLPEGRDVAVVIKKVEAGKVGHGKKEQKRPILFLEGSRGPLEKPMVCNSTNAKTIAGMYGYHVEKWIDQPIALYIGEARDPDGTGMIPAIRVRPTAPKAEPVKGKQEAAS